MHHQSVLDFNPQCQSIPLLMQTSPWSYQSNTPYINLLSNILQTVNHGLGSHSSLTPHGFIVRESFLSHSLWLGWLFECSANGGWGFGYVLWVKVEGETLVSFSIMKRFGHEQLKNHGHVSTNKISIWDVLSCGVTNGFPSLRRERFVHVICRETKKPQSGYLTLTTIWSSHDAIFSGRRYSTLQARSKLNNN